MPHVAGKTPKQSQQTGGQAGRWAASSGRQLRVNHVNHRVTLPLCSLGQTQADGPSRAGHHCGATLTWCSLWRASPGSWRPFSSRSPVGRRAVAILNDARYRNAARYMLASRRMAPHGIHDVPARAVRGSSLYASKRQRHATVQALSLLLRPRNFSSTANNVAGEKTTRAGVAQRRQRRGA